MAQEMPAGQAPAGAQQQRASGGASQLVADINSKMMELMELVSGKPGMEDAQQQLGALIQGYQGFVDSLSQPPGAQQAPKGPQAPATSTPEAGANPNARPM